VGHIQHKGEHAKAAAHAALRAHMIRVTISIKGILSMNRTCSIRGTLIVHITCSIQSHIDCAKPALLATYKGLLAVLLPPPMPSCLQHNASTWRGWTIAPVSRLKTLPPSATGTPGVGFSEGRLPRKYATH